jgi:nitrate/TMAO reductase-like tetraheme cytochrome c subunit
LIKYDEDQFRLSLLMKKTVSITAKIKVRRSALAVFAIVFCVFVLVKCMGGENVKKNNLKVTFENFAGNEKCAGCHQSIYDSYVQTAHYLTAKPAEEKFIHGSFEKGRNTYAYTPDIVLSMEKRDSGLFQVAYLRGQEKKAMRFDMVIGSGVAGQSFLTWRKNKLFQLPITYFTVADRWSNSPGFPSGKVLIDRPITSRCLECHATYAEGISGPPLEPEEFDRSKMILGVSCEKCHGPALKHIEFQTKNPDVKTEKYIVNPASLSRQLQLDVCAACHGGNIEKLKPSFQFTAGKDLADYFRIDSSVIDVANNGNVDVHGNQYGLLKASKCFKNSISMTCNTCHNTHQNERGRIELFSQKCIKCHTVNAANFTSAVHGRIGAIEKNCIDCHMPAQPSRAIAVNLEGEEVPRASLIRSHFISIYPETTKNFKELKNK